MRISIVTIFPQLFEAFLGTSLIKKALERQLVSIELCNLLDWAPERKRIDEPTVGPGPGMIIKPELLAEALDSLVKPHSYTIFLSPQGKVLNQLILNQLKERFDLANNPNQSPLREQAEETSTPHLILVCGRYEGFDQRVQDAYADMVLSIGDYVLLGGELPAQVFLEGLLRLMPSVVGNQDSIAEESFQSPFLDHPAYGLPVEWKGVKVPDLLLSGNHAAINQWRQEQAAKLTIYERFDWFRNHPQAFAHHKLAQKIVPNHYLALMHNQVYVKGGMEGQTSIKSMDLHDISRVAISYNFQKFFVITSLMDQMQIAKDFLGFWTEGEGPAYNHSRHQAVTNVMLYEQLSQAMSYIEEQNGQKPLVIATSARNIEHPGPLSFRDQGLIFKQQRPVLILLGTGYGLTDQLVASCDYLLSPILGLSDYNHLSVRSAAAIILDRWLGLG